MTIYQPSEELRPFVRYYWVLESNEPFSVLTFPIGCPQIIFHKKSPLYIPELNKSQSKFTISGQVNFPTHIQSDGLLEMIVDVLVRRQSRMRCERILATSRNTFSKRQLMTYMQKAPQKLLSNFWGAVRKQAPPVVL